MRRVLAENIGMAIKDFEIIDVIDGKYLVKCNVCGRQQYLSSTKAFIKRENKHGKLCTMVLANEYGGSIMNGDLRHFYSIWCNLRNRTTNENYEKWNKYGGRGINSDKFKHFVDFYDSMYESYKIHVIEFGEKDTTIERINVDGNYEPSNCKWATWLEQAKNKTNILNFIAISPDGKKYEGKNLKEFCESQDMNYQSIISGIHNKTKRFRNGWDIKIV